MNRLFIGLNIPKDIIDKIIFIRNSVIPNPLDYKWEAPEKLHLTIKFIGDVEQNLVEEIKNEISFISGYKAFNCSLTKFGFFYSDKIPKILWMGLKIDEEIFHLVNVLDKKLTKFNIPTEKRKFKPHLTIMRVKKKLNESFINSFENCKLPETDFIADSVSLIKSELHTDSSIYTKINNYTLLGGI
ncbi:MAG TPA: RNA 2',3'-cyclic phosphodiesterase [Ignavibacteriaceae bacterium]|nr:RNA 2',3'-cyclic phosphodiesterase [Ignavibacteriaceae bacterium]